MKNAPDFVNLIYAHELTHKKIGLRKKALKKWEIQPKMGEDTDPYADGEALNDLDEDGISNGEEIAAGMDPRRDNSFTGAFTISQRSDASRDEEFYCVLGGAFSPFGKLTKPANLVVREYTGDDRDGDGVGVVAKDANEHNDWSKGGVQWQKD